MSRVLVLSSHAGQVDRRIVAEVNALVGSGRDVTLVSVPVDLGGAGIDPRVRVIAPASRDVGVKRAARALPGPLAAAARTLWYRFGAGPLPGLGEFFARTIPAEPFDVVHCHDLQTLPAGLDFKRLATAPIRVVYDSHELFGYQSFSPVINRYWQQVERRHIRAADRVITINESIAAELVRLYGIPTPAVIYNSYGVSDDAEPLDRQTFEAHFRATDRGPTFTVLFHGTLTPERNLPNLVRAFASVRDARLFVLGEGVVKRPLQRLARRHRLGNVFFGDWVPQDRLLSYVRRADLGVIPYQGGRLLNNRLATPNKLFEFLEAGVPICASDLPELRRIVRDGGIGAVYPMDSPAQIAAALNDCIRRCRAGEFHRDRLDAARERFSWRRQADTLLDLYSTLER